MKKTPPVRMNRRRFYEGFRKIMELFALIRHGCAVPPVHYGMIATGNHFHFDSLRGAPLVRDDTVSFRLFSIDLPIASRTILTQFVRGGRGALRGAAFRHRPLSRLLINVLAGTRTLPPEGSAPNFQGKLKYMNSLFCGPMRALTPTSSIPVLGSTRGIATPACGLVRNDMRLTWALSDLNYSPVRVWSSLANLATMLLRASTASRLGMTIRPLNMSDISQTRETFCVAPTAMNTRAITP